MHGISKKLIIMLSLYSVQIITMEQDADSEKSLALEQDTISEPSVDVEPVIEAHPFMISSVNQALQTIKDNGLYGPSTDEDNDIIRDARAVFQEQMEEGSWVTGTWDDGGQWKVSTRCGLGLCTFLTGNVKEGRKLILSAARMDNSAWARYYAGVIELVAKQKPDIVLALEYFKKAHADNPDQIPAHWYRHLMAMLGYCHSTAPADWQPKENWVTWADECLLQQQKVKYSYPLARYARTCRDEVGAELMCLKVAAENKNVYQKEAISRLCHCCITQRNGAPHPYAKEAEEILRGIGRHNKYHYIQEVIQILDKRRKNTVLGNLKAAAEGSNPNQRRAIKDLYYYCTVKKNGAPHPYARQAEEILREIGSRNGYHYLKQAIQMLDEQREQEAKDSE